MEYPFNENDNWVKLLDFNKKYPQYITDKYNHFKNIKNKGIIYSPSIQSNDMKIYSPVDGEILSYKNNTIIIKDDKYKYILKNITKFDSFNNYKITKGQHIGELGVNGSPIGIHLYFEIQKEEKVINPEKLYQEVFKIKESKLRTVYNNKLNKAIGIENFCKVGKGDNIFKIAQILYPNEDVRKSINKLMDHNGISNINLIFINQIIYKL